MKEGYKQTELGIIPEDWEIKKLGDLGIFFKGKGVPKSEITNEGYNCLTYGDLYTKYNIVIKNVKSFITQEVAELSHEIVYGDICFAASGETLEDIGKSAVYLESTPGYAGGDIIVFRGNQNALTLAYFLNSDGIKSQMYKLGQGHSVVHIYKSQIENLKIPLPPIEEQNVIANCLSTWDEAIDKQQKLIEAKETRHRALIQKLLSGKRRLPGFTDEWREYKFSDLIEEVRRGETWDDTKLYDLISVKRRSGGVFHRESLYGHQIEVKSLVKIKENDFLISKMQIVHGASSIVSKKFEDYYVSGSYIILNIKNEKILSPKYLNLYSKQKSFYYQTFVSSYGVHIEKMTFDFKTFLKMSAIIPTLSEQNRIVEIIEISEQELEIEKQKLDQLKEQKKALMQKLLTGKVRLPLNN